MSKRSKIDIPIVYHFSREDVIGHSNEQIRLRKLVKFACCICKTWTPKIKTSLPGRAIHVYYIRKEAGEYFVIPKDHRQCMEVFSLVPLTGYIKDENTIKDS